jgi:CRISPR/Cas system-associated protein Csx1
MFEFVIARKAGEGVTDFYKIGVTVREFMKMVGKGKKSKLKTTYKLTNGEYTRISQEEARNLIANNTKNFCLYLDNDTGKAVLRGYEEPVKEDVPTQG